MYNLGEQFTFDYTLAKANPENVIQGKYYRFTILSERVIRMEYNEEGLFEDRPSTLIWYRNMAPVSFTKKETDRVLEITTKYFHLRYVKEKPFDGGRLNAMSNLRVDLLNSDRIWYYNHPEVRNYGAPGMSLDAYDKKLKLKKGLYSTDGFATINDAEHMILTESGTLEERSIQGIDLYLFMYLKDFSYCLQDYFALTGQPALLPRYALGNWWGKEEAYDDATLSDLISKFKDKGIPLSIVLLNESWHLQEYNGKKRKSGFTWNQNQFSDPNETVSFLHRNGIRLGLNVKPLEGFFPYEENYEKIKEYIQPDKNGVIPFHALNPETLDLYFKLCIHPLDEMGVDFYFIDELPKNPMELWALNHYHYFDMQRDYKRRAMICTRNAMIAPHRYPVLYSGKSVVGWDTLRMIPFYNGNATNMGISYWSHDLGGYYNGMEDSELYIRYVQLGVFSPILKLGSEDGKYYKREPWRWDYKTYKIVKDYMNLRHRMIPYIYTEAYKYHKFGTPMITPIYYKFPEMYDDMNYRNGYYFGSELFICPIINKKEPIMNRVIHKFFLPSGVWYDYVTGKKFPGGKKYISFFKDEDYPVFAKAGSIIVLGDHENINDTTPPERMEIQIFPGRSNSYDLYEDDGVSELYKKQYYLITNIDYNYMPNNYTVIMRPIEGKTGIVPEYRDYKFVFRNTKEAEDVIVYFNDQKIEANSYVEDTNFIVEVKHVSTLGQLTLNCKGKDIEIDAVRIINDDIESIISDLPIETKMKTMIDHVMFSDDSIKKKRIGIRKLSNHRLERKYIKLFLKLLDYIKEV